MERLQNMSELKERPKFRMKTYYELKLQIMEGKGDIMGVFIWNFLDKKSFFLWKKSVFIYLDNFLKIIKISKNSVISFL